MKTFRKVFSRHDKVIYLLDRGVKAVDEESEVTRSASGEYFVNGRLLPFELADQAGKAFAEAEAWHKKHGEGQRNEN